MHERYHQAREILMSAFEGQLAKGVECWEGEGMSQLSDMIKDMEEAQEKHWKSCYYKLVCEAMLGATPEYDETKTRRSGYNHRHMANGQFATAGHGHMVAGFHMDPSMTEMSYMNAYMQDPKEFEREMNRRHFSDGHMDGPNMRDGWNHRGRRSGYGQSYEEYQDAKRHYTETKSMQDKEKMNHHAEKHTEEFIDSFKELYMDADPMLQKRLIERATRMIDDLPKR